MTPKGFTLKSYAKLNLTLSVKGRRPDGFHELETLFERVDLYDELDFSRRSDGKIVITCDHRDVPTDERNLAYKAAALVQAKYRVRAGASIHITKRIPVAAGMAGGSSNAATALMGVSRLWKLGLSSRALGALAAQLGSDINFFLHDTPWALGTSRGEKIRPLSLKARLIHLVVVPEMPILAKDAYAAYAARTGKKFIPRRERLTKISGNVSMLLCSLRKKDTAKAGQFLFNDLEEAILDLRPGLLRLKKKLLSHHPLGVCFSGSGPSIFALTATHDEAARLQAVLARTYRQIFVVHTA